MLLKCRQIQSKLSLQSAKPDDRVKPCNFEEVVLDTHAKPGGGWL